MVILCEAKVFDVCFVVSVYLRDSRFMFEFAVCVVVLGRSRSVDQFVWSWNSNWCWGWTPVGSLRVFAAYMRRMHHRCHQPPPVTSPSSWTRSRFLSLPFLNVVDCVCIATCRWRTHRERRWETHTHHVSAPNRAMHKRMHIFMLGQRVGYVGGHIGVRCNIYHIYIFICDCDCLLFKYLNQLC